MSTRQVDVLVVGGGQAGLAVGYYLRRAGYRPEDQYVLLDASDRPGGAWARMWPSLRAFSPPEYSSLPGWRMPAWRGDPAGPLRVSTTGGDYLAGVVVSCTGTWSRPFVPTYPGQGDFAGRQLHAAEYAGAEEYAGGRVVVVGGGNSAAQILAEVSAVASTTWVTQRPPKFLPDDVDGRALFMVATARRRALESGGTDTGGVAALGDIVMVPVVREARERGALRAEPMFERVTRDGVAWADGREQAADAIIWCTGFRPELRHLAPLGLRYADGHLAVLGTQAVDEPRLHLVGYGDWTGPASATLIGVGRTARDLVASL